MFFQLQKLILWPKNGSLPRVLSFKAGVVNVISGASKTGKSAVIPIVDYCLGADKCAIPVGVIRENCAWFGVVVDTVEGPKLLARREPGDQQKTGDMLFLEGEAFEVPEKIEGKTTNVEIVKAELNRLAGLTALEFDPGAEGGFRSRPSFRDLMAFTFQPQNIVANPDVMFFKADTTEHREKLKTIFPYVLGAITAKVMQAQFELDRLTRILRRKDAELREMVSATSAWRVEVQGWIRQAVELGLISATEIIPDNWLAIIDMLRRIVATNSREAAPSLEGIEAALSRLEVLRNQETEIASELSQHRQKLNELRRLIESSTAYGDAMLIQRDRLALSSWLRTLGGDVDDPVATLGDEDQDKLSLLCEGLQGLEVQLRTHPTLSDTLDKEVLRQRAATEIILTRLHETRREILSIERDSEEAREEARIFDRTERFLGRLEQALQLYDRVDQASGIREEIDGLRAEIEVLQKLVSEGEIRRRRQNALDRVQAIANRLVPQLDAEWPDAPIKLIIEDLTIKIARGSRDDFLWEIGSGANWLAYHISLTLALQKFFLEVPHHPVPGLLVFDQPSQVYFPKRTAYDDSVDMPAWKDEDILAVKKVFSLLAAETLAAKGRIQTIVLDHADEDVWGEFEGIELIEEWRDGEALVPREWIGDAGLKS